MYIYIYIYIYISYNVYVYEMFYYEILWIYHNFKSENLCFLNLY